MKIGVTTPVSFEERKLDDLISRLTQIRRALVESEGSLQGQLKSIDPSYLKSARNLIHYLALRHRDVRPLQQELAELGLSSLGRAEAHVMATLDAVLAAIHSIARRLWRDAPNALEFQEGNKLLRQHTEALLGPAPPKRVVRIMVTMPREAASDYQFVRELVAGGMDCMRINCSYDGPEQWVAMAEHLKHARRDVGRNCRISMDLAGPKLRVGPIEPGPEVIKVGPRRDAFGTVVAPAKIVLIPEGTPSVPLQSGAVAISIATGPLASLRSGDRIELVDTRGSSRRLLVGQTSGGAVEVECDHSAYLASGMELRCTGERKGTLRIGHLPARDQPIVLRLGDEIVLTNKLDVGRGLELDAHGQMLGPAAINCSIPQILSDIKPGERIWFDDGKIGGVIKTIDHSEATIKITHASPKGAKLRANKGINLPDSNLSITSLTPKDLQDLQIVAAHADIVGMSFVREASDVEMLQAQLSQFGRPDLGILLKIETRKGFDNLPQLVLAAMRRAAAGVMIARGDLAVECGYERTAEIQEEILWVCEAAHMPVVWATQVLETLAKTGFPSRAEITDAAMGQRAECVMLNKGPHLCEAVATLDDILQRMQDHQVKKSAMLRELKRW
jgi:pyruvate kinase